MSKKTNDFMCGICEKSFNSNSSMYYHKREKHTYTNTILTTCTFCTKEFHSIMGKNKLLYTKCEECRDIQKSLNTNNLVNDTYVYDKNSRYYLNNGNVTKACQIYTCNTLIESDLLCDKHVLCKINICNGTKCNNIFKDSDYNYCENCRDKNALKKDKIRNEYLDFKIKLGGKCVECNETDLFKLEFDHINPLLKKCQITRSASSEWIKEIDNLKLLCGICHRIKSHGEQKEEFKTEIITKSKKFKDKQKNIVMQIKLDIGKCQLCNWTCENKTEFAYVMDFDHIIPDEKTKQVSDMYSHKLKSLLDEIELCRLICRNCHQLHTCMQRGGKMLKIYYTESQIKEFEKKFNDHILNKTLQNKVKNIVEKYRQNT